jgi:hypothetical protein
MNCRPKTTLALIALAGLLAGCGASSTHHRRSNGAAASSGSSGSGAGVPVAALRDEGWTTDFARRSVPLSEFQPGGPPRDGIPPIDHPKIVSIAAGDRFLTSREPVIVVSAGGQTRAYPERILVWHEIVNDVLGGEPIAVTYCPLCNSAIAFDRRLGSRTLTFGTTGMLRNSDLVMWDRQTQSWWQQFTGTALVGSLTGAQLHPLDAEVLSWQMFKVAFPDGTVLSQRTGFERPYGTNPYVGYDEQPPTFFTGRVDPRLPAKERVVAIFGAGGTAVVPFSRLSNRPVVDGKAGRTPFVVFYHRGVVSALDAERIPGSHDVGTAAAFGPRVGRRTLTFRPGPSAGEFTDVQTGSTWDLSGVAMSGQLRGRQLAPIRHDEQYWFALAAFVPGATLVR